MKRVFVAYALLFVLSMPCLSGAADENKKTVRMGEVVVTAGRVEEKKEDVTTNITVLTEEEIEKSSVVDLVDLLEEQGFTIREYPNSLASVNIRGFTTDTHGNDLSSSVLILIDGRRSGTGNIAEIPLDNVERIEIIRGPGATQYGASALGGVVNIITKQGKDSFSAYAETTMGSWDYSMNEIGASGKINNFDFSFSGSKESQDDYDIPGGQRYYNTGFDSKKRISINAGWSFLENNRIGLTYSSYDSDKIGSPSYLSQNDLDDYAEHSTKNLDLTYYGKTFSGAMEWSLRYYNTEREYETFGNSYYFQNTDQEGLQAQLSSDLKFIRLTGGVDWVTYDIEDSYTAGSNSYDNPAAFLLVKSKLLNDRLILSAGLRFDKFDVEAVDGRKVSDDNLTPGVGATYKITEGLSIRTNYAEAFKMPSADQLFMFNDYSAWGFGIWSGNENLKPEKSKTYEIGIDYTKGTISTGLTYYITDFKDKIGYTYIPEENLTQYQNISGAKLSGIEGSFGVDMGDIFDLSWEIKPFASLSYLLKYEDEDTGIDLKYNPEWSTSYGIRVSNPDLGFVTSFNFAYFSSQGITDYEGTGASKLPSYKMADLSISKELFALKEYGRFLLKGNISNLFNSTYAPIQGYFAPGRTFNLGLRYEY
jgi:vitamin B12 transporter